MSINIRPVKPEDVPYLANTYPDGIDTKHMASMYVVVDDNDIPQVCFSFQHRYLIEPMLLCHDRVVPKYIRYAMGYVDGVLSAFPYEFYVPDSNPQFQEFCRRELPVKEHREVPGLFFTRIREKQ